MTLTRYLSEGDTQVKSTGREDTRGGESSVDEECAEWGNRVKGRRGTSLSLRTHRVEVLRNTSLVYAYADGTVMRYDALLGMNTDEDKDDEDVDVREDSDISKSKKFEMNVEINGEKKNQKYRRRREIARLSREFRRERGKCC